MENHLRAYGDPNISAVERNHIAHFEGTLERETEYETEHETEHETGCPPNDPFFSEQWALPDLHFPTADVVDALAWCIDHQRERRGPGPINVSINIDPPFTYNSSPFIQALAKALRAQGDLFVQGAGNSGLEDPTPEQFIRRVAATDEHDQLASFSVFGPFQVAAPGVDILTFGGNNAVAFLSGTSLSTAYWSGPIAFLMSLCPKLTAPAADAILFNTATVTKQGYHIPNLEAARDRGDSD
jgi:subtilisin family serine protease